MSVDSAEMQGRVRRGGLAVLKRYVIGEKGKSWGVEYSRILAFGKPYLDRYILYVNGWTLRLHKFWQGDDPRAPHDHPWTFWTFPLCSYMELQHRDGWFDFEGNSGWSPYRKLVHAFRIHRRDPTYKHIVLGRADGSTKPFWTIVLSRPIVRKWGFWPKPDQFVSWQVWE